MGHLYMSLLVKLFSFFITISKTWEVLEDGLGNILILQHCNQFALPEGLKYGLDLKELTI